MASPMKLSAAKRSKRQKCCFKHVCTFAGSVKDGMVLRPSASRQARQNGTACLHICQQCEGRHGVEGISLKAAPSMWYSMSAQLPAAEAVPMHCCFDAPVKRLVLKELGHAAPQEKRLQGSKGPQLSSHAAELARGMRASPAPSPDWALLACQLQSGYHCWAAGRRQTCPCLEWACCCP